MKYTALSKRLRSPLGALSAVLLLVWCVGIFGRGYWTPDEPREAGGDMLEQVGHGRLQLHALNAPAVPRAATAVLAGRLAAASPRQ